MTSSCWPCRLWESSSILTCECGCSSSRTYRFSSSVPVAVDSGAACSYGSKPQPMKLLPSTRRLGTGTGEAVGSTAALPWSLASCWNMPVHGAGVHQSHTVCSTSPASDAEWFILVISLDSFISIEPITHSPDRDRIQCWESRFIQRSVNRTWDPWPIYFTIYSATSHGRHSYLLQVGSDPSRTSKNHVQRSAFRGPPVTCVPSTDHMNGHHLSSERTVFLTSFWAANWLCAPLMNAYNQTWRMVCP